MKETRSQKPTALLAHTSRCLVSLNTITDTDRQLSLLDSTLHYITLISEVIACALLAQSLFSEKNFTVRLTTLNV